jgi:hypothetical protein
MAELAYEHAPVMGGAVEIILRIEIAREGVERIQECITIERAEVAGGWTVGNAPDRKPSTIVAGNSGAGHDGKVAMAACELAKGVAMTGPARRKAHGLDQFVVSTRRRH